MNCTLVVGVDGYHLDQLSWTWLTWKKNKPSLLKMPMLVFRDRDQVSEQDVLRVVDHPDLLVVEWPPPGVVHAGGSDKWTDPQRYKMLSGFVHVPASRVKTDYWLKLDTDVVATGCDHWIDQGWFSGSPAIVCQPWGFTKPADQMIRLDEWAELNKECTGFRLPPLKLAPREGSDRVRHKRIISWCGFFHTAITAAASRLAEMTVGRGQLPVPSQDGFLWYVAARLGTEVKRVQMKGLGWEHWSTMHNVAIASKRAMEGGMPC